MEEPITINGLTKNYNGFLALDSLDLKVERNRFMGFLGPNGAGKTTTIKILTNLIRATRGSAYLNGVDVVKRPKEALSQVGSVVETPEFYPYLNPMETMMYLGSLRGMTREEIGSRSVELLEIVKLHEVQDKRIGEFSKGMKQRLAIAQALLHEPSVIILDEPTSGLDPRGMVEVRELLKDLQKEDYTIFMSSHLLNEVQEVCDYVALIDRGKLLAHGSVEELTKMTQCRRLHVTSLSDMDDELVERIGRVEGVDKVTPLSRQQLTLEFRGGEGEQAELLRDLMDMGIEVTSFREEGVALESLYMSLIKDSR
ncbi:MAG: ABC transporter ATP-binding protein [Methanomassiliicoccales archaeon]